METYSKPNDISAHEALFEAQKIAFAPFVFQAVNALLKLGILKKIEGAGKSGISFSELSNKLNITEYGVKVLLDMALSARVVWQDKETENFVLDQVGYFLLNDEMTRVNFNFTADVNYAGLERLTESVQESRPAGLQVFDKTQETIYPILSKLPEGAKRSWFEFDHFYSDRSFNIALKKVFAHKPTSILDIGANTGKFSKACLEFDSNVQMTLMDLPGQLNVARENLLKFKDRATYFEANVLDPDQEYPKGVDVVWMSQFLDCFSYKEIVQILKKAKGTLKPGGRIIILELFWDQQAYEAASFSLNAISLYFTAMANGNSRMYHSKEFRRAISEAELSVEDWENDIGIGGHSMVTCKA